MRRAQIQPLRAGVYFQPYAAPCGFGQHPFHIERKRIAVQQQTPSGMAHRRQPGAFQRPQQTIRHGRRFQIHMAVDAADHQVKLSQRIPLNVHLAFLENVALQA